MFCQNECITLTVEKVAQCELHTFVIKKTAQSELSPNGQIFAQTGHPVWGVLNKLTVPEQNFVYRTGLRINQLIRQCHRLPLLALLLLQLGTIL
jgi:hypothetical protein